MTIREIASGGGIAFVVLTLVQIAPVKLNPWTWLARAIGRAINGDVLRKLDETRKIFLCQVGTKKFLRFYKPFIGG